RDRRDRWWAALTGGILVTLAVTALVPGLLRGGLLFLGLAAVFLYLYRHPSHNKSWAIYPAVGLLVLAGLSIVSMGGWLLPVALVAAGIYLLSRNGNNAELKGLVDEAGTKLTEFVRWVERALGEVRAGGRTANVQEPTAPADTGPVQT